MIKEERRRKFGNEPSTGFNGCNGWMLRFEERRKRLDVGGSRDVRQRSRDRDLTDGC
ncbi:MULTISPECIES: hypothetical protein [unclassified Microcoleus]|uniref:hypothetical protein n=1 Tax=unclassified Microcoleus TaxID=2642155 RepID=UPI002FD2F394